MSGQSPQSRLGAKMMPLVSKRVFPPEWIQATDQSELQAIAKKRRSLDGPRPPLSGWSRAATNIANRPLHLFTPKTGSTGRVLFYCHGGAFVVGPTTLEWSHAAKFASAIGCDLALYDYPKVPGQEFVDNLVAAGVAATMHLERFGQHAGIIANTPEASELFAAAATQMRHHLDS